MNDCSRKKMGDLMQLIRAALHDCDLAVAARFAQATAAFIPQEVEQFWPSGYRILCAAAAANLPELGMFGYIGMMIINHYDDLQMAYIAATTAQTYLRCIPGDLRSAIRHYCVRVTRPEPRLIPKLDKLQHEFHLLGRGDNVTVYSRIIREKETHFTMGIFTNGLYKFYIYRDGRQAIRKSGHRKLMVTQPAPCTRKQITISAKDFQDKFGSEFREFKWRMQHIPGAPQ